MQGVQAERSPGLRGEGGTMPDQIEAPQEAEVLVGDRDQDPVDAQRRTRYPGGRRKCVFLNIGRTTAMD